MATGSHTEVVAATAVAMAEGVAPTALTITDGVAFERTLFLLTERFMDLQRPLAILPEEVFTVALKTFFTVLNRLQRTRFLSNPGIVR
jgi:hypothetical protein